MISSAEREELETKELRLLLFSVCGIRFAADADQVSTLRECNLQESVPPAIPFHEAIGYETGPVAYRRPEICTITGEAGQCSFMIESPEDIATVAWDDLQPLPTLVEPFAVRWGIWAGIPGRHGIRLVVDLDRLATSRNLWRAQGDIS
ncbi:MAG TPA: hypothetical protein PLI53_06375 [Geobacteraceae bacterium]|nr:hypothetical protein [Geobacteraceae bacterium]